MGVNSDIKYNSEIFMIDKTKRTMSDVNAARRDGTFRIIVHNANNVPSTERFQGSPDPYVNVFYHGSFIISWNFSFLLNILLYLIILCLLLGIKKQTNWQRSTCDPKWDEVDKICVSFVFCIQPIVLDARFSSQWCPNSKCRHS